jgi:phosphoenolpyruvate carboxykinase (ATP)
VTRALVTGALDGSLKNAQFRTDKYFGFAVPTSVPEIDIKILNPDQTWADSKAFDETARRLVAMFQKNFRKFEETVDAEVKAAAPHISIAAE